jgi:hypothetical protein
VVGELPLGTATGEARRRFIRVGNGFSELLLSPGAATHQDPLGFACRISYETAVEVDNERPRDEIDLDGQDRPKT